MRFKNIIGILIPNFNVVYKNLLYKAVILVVSMLLVWLVIFTTINDFVAELAEQHLVACVDSFKTLINAFFSGEDLAACGAEFQYSVEFLFDFIGDNYAKLRLPAILTFVVFFVCHFFAGLSNFAQGEVVNGYMSSLSHLDFFSCFFNKFRKACLYQLIFTAITFVYFVLMLAVELVIIIFGIKIFSFFALPLAIVAFILMLALRFALFDSFLPELVDGGKSIKKALSSCFSVPFKERNKTFSVYLVLIFLLFYINVSVAVFTLAGGLLITLPLTSLCMVCAKFVNYYSRKRKKYYIDYNNIVVPAELRDEDGGLLKNLDV